MPKRKVKGLHNNTWLTYILEASLRARNSAEATWDFWAGSST